MQGSGVGNFGSLQDLCEKCEESSQHLPASVTPTPKQAPAAGGFISALASLSLGQMWQPARGIMMSSSARPQTPALDEAGAFKLWHPALTRSLDLQRALTWDWTTSFS